MKTKKLLRKILTAGFLITLLILVVMACKKKEDDPTPTPTPPVPPSPENPVVFSDRQLNLKTAWETTHGKKFAALNFRSMGKAFVGEEDPEIPDFKEIGKTLWDIHDYIHTEHEFKEIDDDLNTLIADANELMTMITQLGQQISMQTTDLESFFSTGEISQWVSSINEQYAHSTANTFGYYTWLGSQYEQGLATQDQMNAASQSVVGYANAVFLSPTGNQQMAMALQEIHDNLVNPAPGTQSGLKLYAQTLVNHGSGLIGDNSANAMIVYQMLENYFLWCLTAQYQAETVLLNCASVLDSTGVLNYYNTSLNQFEEYTNDEISAFISAVNYLVVNLDDYRDRWPGQYAYADAGLAPDLVWTDVLARSQLVVNAILNGLSTSDFWNYSIMGGRIIIPSIYNSGNTVNNQISVNINGQTYPLAAHPTQSMIPYTTWTPGNPATCDYDDTWNIYIVGDTFTAGSEIVWRAGANDISIVMADQNTPWVHNTPCNGTVTVYYYNPQDLGDKSTTQDATHTMPYGFFSVNWKWGYLYLKYNSENAYNCGAFQSEQLVDYAQKYGQCCVNCNESGMWDGETTPFVVGCNKNWAVCSQPFGQYYYTSGIGLTEVGYNGPAFNYSEGQVCYVYNIANRITAARTIPSNTAWFVAAGNIWYNFGNQANMNCGVGYQTIYCMSEGTSVCSNNLFQIKNTSAGNTASGTGYGHNFSANQQQEFNFGFDLFLNKTVPSYNLQVKCNQNAQVIFGGYASETAP